MKELLTEILSTLQDEMREENRLNLHVAKRPSEWRKFGPANRQATIDDWQKRFGGNL